MASPRDLVAIPRPLQEDRIRVTSYETFRARCLDFIIRPVPCSLSAVYGTVYVLKAVTRMRNDPIQVIGGRYNKLFDSFGTLGHYSFLGQLDNYTSSSIP